MGVTEQSQITTAREGVLALESTEIRRIVPTKRRIRPLDIFRESGVVQVLASRDFKVKYKQSMLGPLWLIIQPFALLAAFLVAFRGVGDVEPGTPYVVFALGGLMIWSFFQASMTIGGSSLITNFQLVRYTPCMRMAFPVAATIASLPALAVTALAAITAAAVTGDLSSRAVLLPLSFVWLFVLTIGVVIVTAALAVRFRDVINVVPFILQVGLFLAPVGYSLYSLSEPVRAVIDLNPLTGLIEASRWMLIAGYSPSFEPIGISLVLTAAIAVTGWLVFSRFETTMSDEI